MKRVTIRRGMPNVQLSKEEFARRFRDRFYDPAFAGPRPSSEVVDIAWNAYDEYRKSPRTRPAGREFADPGLRAAGRMARHRRSIRRPSAARRIRSRRRASC